MNHLILSPSSVANKFKSLPIEVCENIYSYAKPSLKKCYYVQPNMYVEKEYINGIQALEANLEHKRLHPNTYPDYKYIDSCKTQCKVLPKKTTFQKIKGAILDVFLVGTFVFTIVPAFLLVTAYSSLTGTQLEIENNQDEN